MQYITEEHLNYNPHYEDIFILTKSYPPFKLMYGEPIVMETWEQEWWERFLQNVKDKGLKPLGDLSTDHRRLGYAYLYLFKFTF